MWRYRASVVVLLLVGALVGVPVRADAALAPPPNDAFADAQVITGTSGRVDGNIAGATTEPGEPGGDTPQPSIWYRWTAPQSGLYRFDATTGVFKPGMGIYTGTSLSTLQRPSTDWCPPTAYDGAVYVLPATAGTSYVLSLTGYSANVEPGATTLRWGPHTRPANDAFAAATVVTSLDPVLAGDNCAATAESGEPLDQYTSRRTVWFSWTPGVTAQEAVRDVPQHLIVTVYTGSSPGALTRVARSASVHGEYGTEFMAQAGTTYRIQVDSQGNPPFGVVGPQPPFRVSMIKLGHCNDAFSCATGLTSDVPLPLSGSDLSDNIGATAEAGEPAHAGSTASHSLWWQLTPPVGATVTVSTAGSGIDTVLAVYTGATVGALTRVVEDDDAAGSGASRVSFAGAGGRTYFVAVDGKAGATGQVKITWQLAIPAPPNDMFAAATVISGAQGTAKSYTWSATKEAGEPAHEGVTGGRSVWWRYTATAAGRLHLVSSGDFTVLAVYRGSAVSALTRVAGARQAGLDPIVLDVDVAAGVTYSIALDVTDLVHGPDIAELTWSLFPPRPPNDYVGNATLISGTSGAVDGHDVGATRSEVAEPYGSTSVFYRWTAPSSGLYVFDTITSDFDTEVWIYRGWGTSLAPLTRVTWNEDAVTLRDDPDDFRGVVGADHTSAAGLTAVGGQVYTILLAGPELSQGRFRLHWAPAASWRPPNDAFAAAQTLTGGSGSVTGRVSDSTVEPGEPGEAYGTIWYTWTAPTSGPVRFWTGADAARHPLLSVYTGSTLSTLTLLGENGYGISTPGSRLDLTVTAGTTYRIRMAGWDGSSVYWPGTATLRWGPPPPAPANDAFAAATAVSGATGSVDGNSEWATREPGEPTGNGWPVGSVWYRWTAPSSGSVSFWVTDGELYPMVDVYTGGRVDALTQAEGFPPNDEQVHPGARTTVRVTAGTTYAIQVQGSDYVNGPFHLRWSMARPPHDDLASAVPLSGREGVSPPWDWSATTIRATAESAEPRHDPDRAPAATVWFRWTAPASGPVTFEASANTASMVAAYTGTGYGSLTQVGRTGWEHSSDLRFDAVGGTTYLIVADGGPYGGGELRLRWSQHTDFTRPTGTLVIDGGASSTGKRMVTLTLNATDNVRVTGVRVSNSAQVDAWSDPGGNTQWVLRGAEELAGATTTVSWSLTDLYRGGNNSGGTKTVYAQWCDEQGNWSPIASDTIVADLPPIGDTQPPTGSVTVNAGASYTTNASVSLSMPASDLWTGVSQVRISNRADTSGGRLTYGADREWTATPQQWSLADAAYGGSTANGTRSVYVQFRDGAGNWSPVYSDTIVLDTVAPAVKAPAAVPATGSQATSSVPTRVTWSATDATSGVAAYQLEQSLDGGTWTNISLATALTTSVVRTLTPGHTYRFRVRSSDRAGLWSGWQYGPVLTPALHQETSTAFTWSGTWTRTALTGASGGYVRYSSQAGARATFTTSARAVGWVAVRGPTRGKATVYVDGTAVATVDLYASTVQPARVVYAYSWASTGTHTVVVHVSGTSGRPRVDVDAVVSLR